MLPFAGRFESFIRSFLRSLPLSEYQKTRLWATSVPRPVGPVKGLPYYRCIELGALALASPNGYGGFILDRDRTYSVIEFGVANGEGFQLMLHCRDTCLKKYGLKNKIIAVGFDSFEGMPEPRDGDDGLIWRKGDLPSDLNGLRSYLDVEFTDFELVKGYFKDTLVRFRNFLLECPPIFVSIDCDYYSSTMDVLDFLLPDLVPNGCLFYFDDVSVNFYSNKTGEMKAIAEVNAGRFGSHIQLIEYPLWIETREMRHYRQIYRYFNLEIAEKGQQEIRLKRDLKRAPRTVRISPL